MKLSAQIQFSRNSTHLVPRTPLVQDNQVFLRSTVQVAALMTAVHWVVHGGARDALEYQVGEERSKELNCLSYRL